MLIILLFVFGLSLNTDLELPTDKWSPGWVRAGQPIEFNKNDLYGHINGGAELFLEYGFEKLVVQRYKHVDDEIEVECYLMSDHIAALGIYLMKMGSETANEEIRARNSFNPYQVLAVKNNLYLQINNFSGKQIFQPQLVSMTNIIMDQIDDEVDNYQDPLPGANRVPGSLRLIRGIYALQPIYTFGEGDILSLSKAQIAAYAKYRSEMGETYSLLRILYNDDASAGDSYQRITEHLDPYLVIISHDDSSLIFKDYRDQFGIVQRSTNNIEIRFHLQDQPELKR